MAKQAATISGVRGMGFQLKGTAPAFSNKAITKGELNSWYYVDNQAAGIDTYPNNRVLTLDDLINAGFAKPVAQFYQYDVTRSGIPNATGGFFTYKATDGTTQTILQNAYGYVGRFCMQEGSFNNNQVGLYSISLAGVCYPTYGAYPQPYLDGCNLYFNNLGTYTIEDVKIYQLTDVQNKESAAAIILGSVSGLSQATAAAVGLVPGVNIVWAAVNLLAIAGGVLYGNTSKLTNVLRYIGTGAYTNGSVSLSTVGSTTGTNQYYIAYKVRNPQGFYPIVFGYGTNESAPPGLTSSCAGGTSTTATWTSQGYTTCVSCTDYTVFKDTNVYSSTYNKYKVNEVVGTVDAPANVACNTTANWVDTGATRCNNCVNEKEQTQTNPCATGTTRWVAGGSACNTTQVWTDTGATRCNNCVNEKEQKQTNSCASEYDTLRWVAGGSACSTAATWVVAFGQYVCEGCNQYFVEIDNNPCSSTYNNTRRGALRFTNTTNCGGCCGQSTAPIWSNMDPAVHFYCQGTTKYYKQIDTNPCSPTYNTNQQGVVYQYESPDCGYTGPTYYYYTGIMCGSNIIENFRSTTNLGDGGFTIYGYTSITGNYQCFGDVTRTTTANSNDILSTHDSCFDCENYPH